MVDDDNGDGYFVTKVISGEDFSEVGGGVCLQTVVGYIVSCY